MNTILDFEAVKKYRKRFGTREYLPRRFSNGATDTIIIIPALAELINIERLIQSLLQNDFNHLQHCLFLFVVNNIVSADEACKNENKRTIDFLNSFAKDSSKNVLIEDRCKLHIGIIDASTAGNEMPDDIGGVGLARKIGMDTALNLFAPFAKRRILVSLDADCTVASNYISAIRTEMLKNPNIHCGVIRYEHKIDDADEENINAIVCYELFLRYYTMGLIYARSDYAFHSIGSTIVCDIETYIKVEGMNKRKAGEDFYFLEKIAKQHTVHTINSTKVFPSSRGSHRVPFGTGQRVNRFNAKGQDEYLVYHPESFICLKKWLRIIQNQQQTYMQIEKEAHNISPELKVFLAAQKFNVFWNKAVELPEKQFPKAARVWFDGFRTLKLLHYFRDTAYPLQPMFIAVPVLAGKFDESLLRFKSTRVPSRAAQIELLYAIRKLCDDLL